jgi:hypothetical protein
MPAVMLDRITDPAIARFQVVSGQMGFEVDRWWHTEVVQRYAATAYHTVRSPAWRINPRLSIVMRVSLRWSRTVVAQRAAWLTSGEPGGALGPPSW